MASSALCVKNKYLTANSAVVVNIAMLPILHIPVLSGERAEMNHRKLYGATPKVKRTIHSFVNWLGVMRRIP